MEELSVSRDMFPPRLFITGTDTGIGKTVVAAVLLAGLGGKYWKPIQSGLEEVTDTEWVREKTGLEASHFCKEAYRLSTPASPHLAAAIDDVEIDLRSLALPSVKTGETLIIDGAGGVMVPLNDRQLMTDLIKMTEAPALVVASSGLGMINHTLLTVNCLRSCGIPVWGVVMNGGTNSDNKKAVAFYGKTPVLAQVRRLPEIGPAALLSEFKRIFGG